jgi:anti-sigma-K factor RskA
MKADPPTSLCQSLAELIPAYALGLTDAEETRLVEDHLALCPEAQADLRDYQAMAEALLPPAKIVAPPSRLGQAILSQARPKPKRDRRLWPLAAAAALILALLAPLVWMWQGQKHLEAENTALLAQNQALEKLIRGQSPEIKLLSAENTPPTAFFRWEAGQRLGLLQAQALPPLGDDQSYQVWLIEADETNGQRIRSLGVFQADSSGGAQVLLRLPPDLSPSPTIAISQEPAGGSPSPTTPPFLVGSP